MNHRLSSIAGRCGAALFSALLLAQGVAVAQTLCCATLPTPIPLPKPLSIERYLGPHASYSAEYGLGGINGFGSVIHTEFDANGVHVGGVYNQGTPPANVKYHLAPGLVIQPGCQGLASSVTVSGSNAGGVNGAGMAAATGWLAASPTNTSTTLALALFGDNVYRALCPYRADPGAYSEANAINDYGIVVGVSGTPGWFDIPMLWSAWNTSGLGTPIDLSGTGIPAFARSGARPIAINRGSTVVGWATGDATSMTRVRGWMKRPSSSAIAMDYGANTKPTAVNDAGVVVGSAMQGSVQRAWVWQPDPAPGGMSWLPAPSDGGSSDALAVSNEGSTVAGTCNGRACFWTASCTPLAAGGRRCAWNPPVNISITTYLPTSFQRVLAIADTADAANRDELMLVEGTAQGFDGVWGAQAWVVRRLGP